MTRIRFYVPILGLLMVLGSACDSTSSNVGIDLLDEGGEPVVREVPPSLLEESEFLDITGEVPRVLAGQVFDPLVGTLTATGFFDVGFAFDTTDTSPITSATLRLARDYLYGDTLADVTLDLHEITENWNATGTHADTTLSIGALITSTTFGARDTLVTIPLPESWITENDSTLRTTNFSVLFHGFALESASNTSVVGFDFAGSDLRIITEQDTFNFAISRTLSGVTRVDQPPSPEGRLLLQDGAGPVVKFDFDLDAFAETPLNGAVLRFFVDTAAMQNTPPNFLRPRLETLQLVSVIGDDENDVFAIATATLTDEGHYRFTDVTLRNLLQQTLFGVQLFDHFELRAPVTNNTLNPVLLFDAASEDTAPEILLTLSPSGS